MSLWTRELALLGLGAWLVACGSAATGSTDTVAADTAADTATSDGAAVTDAATDADSEQAAGTVEPDTAPSDAATDDAADAAANAADVDATAPPKTTAFGTITGACGLVSAQLATAAPSFLVTHYAFTGASFDPTPLEAGAKKRYDGVNAGGSSKCSEVMSMQLLVDCEGGGGIVTETEIQYDAGATSITDFAMTIAGSKVGVSVTRAYLGPKVTTYTQADAVKLLTKKLEGINASTAHVLPAHKWTKQVLSVWTLHDDWVPTLQAAWNGLSAELRSDTVVLVTVEQGPSWIVTDDCGAP